MGLWGAAQALAAGFGGLVGAGAVDALRIVLPTDASAFGSVFLAEAGLFVAAAVMASFIIESQTDRASRLMPGE